MWGGCDRQEKTAQQQAARRPQRCSKNPERTDVPLPPRHTEPDMGKLVSKGAPKHARIGVLDRADRNLDQADLWRRLCRSRGIIRSRHEHLETFHAHLPRDEQGHFLRAVLCASEPRRPIGRSPRLHHVIHTHGRTVAGTTDDGTSVRSGSLVAAPRIYIMSVEFLFG